MRENIIRIRIIIIKSDIKFLKIGVLEINLYKGANSLVYPIINQSG